jgi:hypothetical protein
MGKCVLSLFLCQSLRKCFHGSTSGLPRSRITDVARERNQTWKPDARESVNRGSGTGNYAVICEISHNGTPQGSEC